MEKITFQPCPKERGQIYDESGHIVSVYACKNSPDRVMKVDAETIPFRGLGVDFQLCRFSGSIRRFIKHISTMDRVKI